MASSTSDASAGTGRGVLLDSVILIDHFNAISAATEYLKRLGERGCVSAITRAEVLTGFDGAGVEKARKLLDRYRLYVIDGATADLAAALRRRHRWALPDAIQAAVVQLNGLSLATRNTRDFPPSTFPFVEVPYTL